MRRYWDGNFIAEEPRRRRERDEYRDRFFAEQPGERLKDPFSVQRDPAAAADKISGLMQIAKERDQQSGAFLDTVLAEVMQLQLGTAPATLRTGRSTTLRYPDITLPALGRNFFSKLRFPIRKTKQ